MPALVAGIHVFRAVRKTWMAGTIPAMTPRRGHPGKSERLEEVAKLQAAERGLLISDPGARTQGMAPAFDEAKSLTVGLGRANRVREHCVG